MPSAGAFDMGRRIPVAQKFLGCFMSGSKIKALLLALMFGGIPGAWAQESDWPGLDTNLDFSIDVGFSQGWAFDGTNGYQFLTGVIWKKDRNWGNITYNAAPFSGLTNYDHLGAGTYHDGRLYVPMEAFAGCGRVTNQSIGIFDADDLSRISVTVVSNYQNEISAVAVAPDLGTNGIVFTASYCDGTNLFEYALPDLNHVKTLALSKNIPLIQGIGYRHKLIYVDADSKTNGLIYAINPETGEVRQLASITVPGAKEYEGLDVSQGDFRIAEGATGRLYFYHFTYHF
jgi:hypothetical protein